MLLVGGTFTFLIEDRDWRCLKYVGCYRKRPSTWGYRKIHFCIIKFHARALRLCRAYTRIESKVRALDCESNQNETKVLYHVILSWFYLRSRIAAVYNVSDSLILGLSIPCIGK